MNQYIPLNCVKYTPYICNKKVTSAILIIPEIMLSSSFKNLTDNIKSFKLQTHIILLCGDTDLLEVDVLIDQDGNIIAVYDDWGDFEKLYTDLGLDDYFFCCIQHSVNLEK